MQQYIDALRQLSQDMQDKGLTFVKKHEGTLSRVHWLIHELEAISKAQVTD